MHLIEAIVKKDIKKVKELLANGVNPNSSEDSTLFSPLHLAAGNNSLKIVELLIAAGADITAQTEDGITVLDMAQISRNPKILIFLLGVYLGNGIIPIINTIH